MSSEVDQYVETHFPHFSSHLSTQFSPTWNDGSPSLSWMTAFTLPWRWHFISGKPCWAEQIKSFTITSLSASSSQDFSELESRTDLCPLMHSWSVVLGTLKQWAASWTKRMSLLSSASWYAATAHWSCTSFAFEASLLITVIAFVYTIADGEIIRWQCWFLVYAGS